MLEGRHTTRDGDIAVNRTLFAFSGLQLLPKELLIINDGVGRRSLGSFNAYCALKNFEAQ